MKEINLKDFGVVGDGFTDDTEAIQRMINQVSEEQISEACSILARAKDVGAINGWQYEKGAGFFIQQRTTNQLIPVPYGHIIELFEDTEHLRSLVEEIDQEGEDENSA